MDELKLMTTGEYAGVGAIISQRPDSAVIIQRPMEGMPADEAGLIAGDRILTIDGKDFRKSTTPKVSQALKGIAGTVAKVTVMRYSETKPRTFRETSKSDYEFRHLQRNARWLDRIYPLEQLYGQKCRRGAHGLVGSS